MNSFLGEEYIKKWGYTVNKWGNGRIYPLIYKNRISHKFITMTDTPLFTLFFPLLLSACHSHIETKEPVDYVNTHIGNISHLFVPTFPTCHQPNSMLRMEPRPSRIRHRPDEGISPQRSFSTDKVMYCTLCHIAEILK